MQYLIKISQEETFSQEIHDLMLDKCVRSSSSLSSLVPFLHNGLLRLGGRLRFSLLDYDMQHPVILPHNHHLTYLILKHKHYVLGHAGVHQMLSSIREKYWPIRARTTAKRIVRECIKCFRVKPRNYYPKMGELPSCRVTPSFPFEICGVDFAGPFTIKNHKGRGAKIVKCYLSLYVCFVTKAVHIEIVSDLTTESFLASLKRFIARRGKPKEIHSDNATNFRGADIELKNLYHLLHKDNNKIVDALTEEGISWHFIPARSPHFGGLWEAGINRVTFHLRRLMQGLSFTFEELYTLTSRIEAILNSRPLTALSDDPTEFSALTPAHFLIGRKLTSVSESYLKDLPVNRLSNFQHIEKVKQHFWARWSKEYLLNLQQRSKWRSDSRLITTGSLVLLKDENLPPLKRKYGRIIQLYPGQDGITRVILLKTENGTTLKRAVTQVCPFPLE